MTTISTSLFCFPFLSISIFLFFACSSSIFAGEMLSSLKFAVRKATTKDLPTIHGLIKTSFAALNEYVPPEMVPKLEQWAKSLCESELSDEQFEKIYFSSYGTSFFVVEDTENKSVHGCVGVKRLSQDMSELVRMAVSPEIRRCF